MSRPTRIPSTDALLDELELLRGRLRAACDGRPAAPAPRAADEAGTSPGAGAGRSGLDEVGDGFGLSAFERAVLLLAAGPELVGAVADELVAVHGDPAPTFGLALSLLPGAHWSALTPTGPLRRFQLVHLAAAGSVTRAQLTADERVLHHLLGAGSLGPELASVARPVAQRHELPPTLAAASGAVLQSWERRRPVVLQGPQAANLVSVAAAAAEQAGLLLHVLALDDLPTAIPERERVLRLMERETVLSRAAWAVDTEVSRGEELRSGVRAVCGLHAPVVLLGDAPAVSSVADAVQVHVPRLQLAERASALAAALDTQGACRVGSREVGAASGVFDLSLTDLDLAAADVAGGAPLWDACRARSRSRLSGQTQLIAPRAGWDDIVLPPAKVEQLRSLVAAVRHRTRVLHEWGFDTRSGRGLGTAALFAGPSGTGKTLAAEVIAGELGLDLVVVDVSQVVSKYIGETEKNLARVFDAAEDGAAVLLFDEADALFGRRTEVRDSHDRYANLEVGYLLQRIEAFRGLALLTTNAKSALDQAFLRRLRTVVTFPYPDKAAREALWRRAFPAATPTEGLDPARLATVDLPGGGIAAAALTAAYLGAETGVVDADMVATATRWELAKSGRSLGER